MFHMKLEVTVAKSTQTAIPELGKKETTLYYLVIGEGDDKVVINVGEKTFTKVQDIAMKETSRLVDQQENQIEQDENPKTKKPTK